MSSILADNGITIENGTLRFPAAAIEIASIQALEHHQERSPWAPWLNFATGLFAFFIIGTWIEIKVLRTATEQTPKTRDFCIFAFFACALIRYFLPVHHSIVMATGSRVYEVLETTDLDYAAQFTQALEAGIAEARQSQTTQQKQAPRTRRKLRTATRQPTDPRSQRN